ncbi:MULTISPECIES: LysM peptidoglycan-binding domain-containing protein [Bacillus amyloliquefaciens group]|nr:Uncharacterized metalloprotease xlyB1 [Bacillus amyloliquefaciens LL3]AEK87570.1 hypothetical protein BAXH7_00424 [Bacillus amyloliquefaciens XH7]KYC93059.1 hypothetical protein B425_0418 [Bacillus amyloliquefaciens]MCM3249645.1 LysM peptidoglycan-binding domain-containing protein [Bacillus amyloliquefaciens]MCY7425045.1 LysM peptidoglycan-binding domain-containing protein [Bacillus amyloliquefaciens]
MATLQSLNGIKDPNLIKVGQVLKLTGSAGNKRQEIILHVAARRF